MVSSRSLIILFGVLGLMTHPARSEPGWETITMDCSLSPVSILRENAGELHTEDVAKGQPMLLTFTGFDDKNGRAIMVGNLGSTPVFFYDLKEHLQLIEVTETKNTATTTVQVNGETIRAIHSRHMWIGNRGVISVYAGPCVPR